jgi:hypothetical protein
MLQIRSPLAPLKKGENLEDSKSPCLALSFGEALATPLHSSAFQGGLRRIFQVLHYFMKLV